MLEWKYFILYCPQRLDPEVAETARIFIGSQFLPYKSSKNISEWALKGLRHVFAKFILLGFHSFSF